VRYEDLLRNPVEVFAGIVRFCGLPFDEHRVRKAVAFSSFGELQAQERSNGFCERPERSNAPFFRSGEAGRGAEELPPALAERLMDAHSGMLRRFDYSPENTEGKQHARYA